MKSFKSFEDLSKEAYAYLNEQQDICMNKYLIGVHERWFYDQETGLLTFYNNEKPYINIKYESVGSISLVSNTWLWSWANTYSWATVATEILAVRDFGKTHGYNKLTDEKWEADLYDGWEMTAISAYLLQAKGAYRIPDEKEEIILFKIFKNIQVVDEEALDGLKKKFE